MHSGQFFNYFRNNLFIDFDSFNCCTISELAGPGNKPTPAQMELRLVQSKSDIENPKDTFKAQLVPFPS